MRIPRMLLLEYNGEVLEWRYDAASRRRVMVDPNSGHTTYTRDNVGRITQLANPLAEVSTFTYDKNGRETIELLSNQTSTTTIYDGAGRTCRVAHHNTAGVVVDRFSYTYDPAGRRTQCVEFSGDTTIWNYDNSNRLIYDQRTGVTTYRNSYTYDGAGNRNAALNTMGGTTTFTTSASDAANRLTVSIAAGARRTTYSYDACGNQTSINAPGNQITSFAYNIENHLTRATLLSAAIVSYTWAPVQRDATERQVVRNDSSGPIRYLCTSTGTQHFSRSLEFQCEIGLLKLARIIRGLLV